MGEKGCSPVNIGKPQRKLDQQMFWVKWYDWPYGDH